MVLLIEQERIAASEQELYRNISETQFPTSYGTINTAFDYPITTAGNQLIVYSFDVVNTDSVIGTFQLRMKLDGHIFFATGAAVTLGIAGSTTGSVTYAGVLSLPADYYPVLFEGVASSVAVKLKNIKFGLCAFNDQVTQNALSYTTGNLVADITPARKTPLGNIGWTTVIVQVAASTSGQTTIMDNQSDSSTNGVKLLLYGSAVDWTTRYSDSSGNRNAASGTYVIYKQTGAPVVFAITKEDSSTVVNVSIVCCPWILPPFGLSVGGTISPSKTPFPVSTLDFPDGSTLYCNLEPLFLDNNKYFFIGKKRGISFGDASDYYYYPYGTGILACAFTFEVPKVESVGIAAYGWGGCINQIGCDAK